MVRKERLFVFLYKSIETSSVWKDSIVFFWSVFSKTEGGNTHGFGIVLNGEFNYSSIHFSTEHKSDRRILMGHTCLFVKQRQVERELSEMSRLKSAVLEFNGYETVELAIEEEEVDKLFFVTIGKTVVGLDKHEILPETKDEVAYVVRNAFVEQRFVAFFG